MHLKRNGGNISNQTRIHLLKSTVWAAGFITLLSVPQLAFAQTKIEQMVVTAQKRSQDIQSVPASITAFSGETLQERQVSNVQDLFGTTPNVQWMMGSSGVPLVAMRGVSPDGTNGTIDPSIAIHMDGVYQARVYGGLLGILDIESVEVLRGPQGTVYGRNANGGVINFITARPTSEFEGSATVFGGSYARYGARGYVSGPVISDKVEMRVAGLFDRHVGWGKSYTTGQDTEAEKKYAARLSLRLKPIENVNIDLIASHAYTHGTPDIYMMSPPNSPGTGFDPSSAGHYPAIAAQGLGAFTLKPRRNYNNRPAEDHSKSSAATGIITWDITPDISLKSITGVQSAYYHQIQDIDEMAFDYLAAESIQSSHTFSQEFNLNAKLFDRVDLVAGLYFLRDRNNGGLIVPFPESGPPFFAFPGPNPVQLHNPADDLVFDIRSNVYSTSKAGFLDMTVAVTDDLRLLGGIRRTIDRKHANLSLQLIPFPIGCVQYQAPDLDYTSTTYRGGLQYDLTPDIMGYVQWQSGFKTGGWNISDLSCTNAFSPEHIASWEAGVKTTLFDGSTVLNVSAFKYNYRNLQLSRALQTSVIVDNAAKAEIYGAEIELNSYLTDHLKIDAGLGLLHSEYAGNYSASEFPGGPVYLLDGNQLTKAPKVTFNLGLEYTMRVGDLGELKARGEGNYVSRIYYTAFNEYTAKQDGYSLFNLILTFTPDDCPYQVQAYARNLTDKDYRTGALTETILNYARGYWGAPRTFGVEATVKF